MNSFVSDFSAFFVAASLTPFSAKRLDVALVQPLELLQARGDFLGIRARVRRFLFRVRIVAFFVGRRLGGGSGSARVRIRDLLVRIDEARDEILQARFAAQDLVVRVEDQRARQRKLRERRAHLIEAFLDALRDANLAFAREQLDGAHLAHVHADGIRRAAELGVDGRERGRSFLGRVLVVRDGGVGKNQRLGVRCLLVHRDAHIVDHVDDVFDLLRIDDLARQMIVDLAVREVTLLLAFGDEQLELRLTFVFLGLRLGSFLGMDVLWGGGPKSNGALYPARTCIARDWFRERVLRHL